MVKPPKQGRTRVVIEGVGPEIDCGRFPIKRVVGDVVRVEADIFSDGHDAISALLLHRPASRRAWRQVPMRLVGNDRWEGKFQLEELGVHHYTIKAWVDRFLTWRQGFEKKVDAGVDVAVDVLIGADLVEAAAERARKADAKRLHAWAGELRDGESPGQRTRLALDPELADLVGRYPDLSLATTYDREPAIWVERERARFSAWYELFPRSYGEGTEHGTFADVISHLPYVADLGFDIVYLPPIHPIGTTNRKGPNNALEAGPEDPGVPWAIGGEEGGHKAIHPQLGSVDDFRKLVRAAEELGMEIALDVAFQTSPDHPYAREQPEWFRHRPDGAIQFAENPPKRYEDIYPFDFETEDWQSLWEELRSVFEFWIDQGVQVFRVDNPHTKPFAFWEWLIGELKAENPELIFLSEAFTRPKLMYRLAKLGFTQSYTYFTWRNTKPEIVDYFTELTQTPVREFFRPSLWPNTPDILNEYLQSGGRPAFITRLVLAGTLGASFGIYGPAFELIEKTPREPGSEEYLNSEKYEIKDWDLDDPDSLAPLIARLNAIRRAHPALQGDWSLRFHGVDNDQLVAYTKQSDNDLILVVVNLDTHHTQGGNVTLPLSDLGLDPAHPYALGDLLGGDSYLWHGPSNYVELDPALLPAHVFAVERHVRTEQDFDAYR